MRSSERGETAFWLAAALALPAFDVALVVGLNAFGLLAGAPGGFLVGVVLALVVNVAALRHLGLAFGAGAAQVAGAVALSVAMASLALVIFVLGVVAPALA